MASTTSTRRSRLIERIDEGIELTYNLTEPRNHSLRRERHRCAQLQRIPAPRQQRVQSGQPSTCSSYLDDDGEFDVGAYKHTVEVVFTAQEILVGNADYPTEKIAETTRAVPPARSRLREPRRAAHGARPALRLRRRARAWAGGAHRADDRSRLRDVALARQRAWVRSPGYTENAEHMLRVLRMHRAEAAQDRRGDSCRRPRSRRGAAVVGRERSTLAEQYGVRNAQASVLAPTGTISFLMDCDTTGIEPDLGLVQDEEARRRRHDVDRQPDDPRALARLGYTPFQIDSIVAYIDANMSIVGAPHVKAEHLPVFACSMGDNVIHYMGHVRMMAAAQPFISRRDLQDDQHARVVDRRRRRGHAHRGVEARA